MDSACSAAAFSAAALSASSDFFTI
jgi:hypothetical protein